jgi:hypothetical protein
VEPPAPKRILEDRLTLRDNKVSKTKKALGHSIAVRHRKEFSVSLLKSCSRSFVSTDSVAESSTDSSGGNLCVKNSDDASKAHITITFEGVAPISLEVEGEICEACCSSLFTAFSTVCSTPSRSRVYILGPKGSFLFPPIVRDHPVVALVCDSLGRLLCMTSDLSITLWDIRTKKILVSCPPDSLPELVRSSEIIEVYLHGESLPTVKLEDKSFFFSLDMMCWFDVPTENLPEKSLMFGSFSNASLVVSKLEENLHAAKIWGSSSMFKRFLLQYAECTSMFGLSLVRIGLITHSKALSYVQTRITNVCDELLEPLQS